VNGNEQIKATRIVFVIRGGANILHAANAAGAIHDVFAYLKHLTHSFRQDSLILFYHNQPFYARDKIPKMTPTSLERIHQKNRRFLTKQRKKHPLPGVLFLYLGSFS
jgi:hypothetical protein